jgi:hypothetical protein
MYAQILRSVSSFTTSPCSYTIVCAYEIIANQDSIITIGDTADHVTVHGRAAVAASVMGTQWI